MRKGRVRVKLKQDKYLQKPTGRTLFTNLLQNAGNWVKISKKNCKFVRGVLIEIDTIHRRVTLHADRPIFVKFKEIKRIQYISTATNLPKFYIKRLRKMGINIHPKIIYKDNEQKKFDGGKTWPKK